MPEDGIVFSPKSEILSYEELTRLCRIYSTLGIRKIRITGGEPFVRRDLMSFLRTISGDKLFERISITTNGTLTRPFLHELSDLGIVDFNLSIDSLNKTRFEKIARRNCFDEVTLCMQELMKEPFQLKLNTVMMADVNEEDFFPLIYLASENKVDVRFIEEMPFNGTGIREVPKWTATEMIKKLKGVYPDVVEQTSQLGSTSQNFHIPGFKGRVGFIAAYTRSFCGTCNRIRLTPSGEMKTCLYAKSGLSVKELLRTGASDTSISEAILQSINHRYKNGWEAEEDRGVEVTESMATIGG
jgi:molybdenum cofactor biosynthesis enzyme MoaA